VGLPQLWPFQSPGMPRVPRGYERQSSTTTRSAAHAVATMAKTPARTARGAPADLVKLWRRVQSPLSSRTVFPYGVPVQKERILGVIFAFSLFYKIAFCL
jgi:hypothetical protein